MDVKKKKNISSLISNRFLEKALRVNKFAMNKFLKYLSFGVGPIVKLYKINAHTMTGVRN